MLRFRLKFAMDNRAGETIETIGLSKRLANRTFHRDSKCFAGGSTEYGCYANKIIEPLVQLRKDGVRRVAEDLGLPESIFNRKPFPGPALAARVIGEATPARIGTVRKATGILEDELGSYNAFQCMAILHQDRVTGMRGGKRDFGHQIEVRCWDSVDARHASPTELPWGTLKRLAGRMTAEVPGVVSVTYNIASKPPSTMEAV